MSDRLRALAVLMLATLLAAPGARAADAVPADEAGADMASMERSRFTLTGYDKLLGISSRTNGPQLGQPDEGYGLGLNRLRLKLRYQPTDTLELRIENDTEYRFGSYLGTRQFQADKTAAPTQFWYRQSELYDEHRQYLTNRMFRAYAKASLGEADVTVGRQRVPLGTGRIWSTVDMLNPINPLQIERDEYVGVDAALVEFRLGPLSKLLAIYAPDPAHRKDRAVFQYRTHDEATDYSLTAGRYGDDDLVGADFATQLGDMGVHGEWSSVRPRADGRASYGKALLGLDYAFANTFNIAIEAYWSGQSRADRDRVFSETPLLRQLQPVGTRYLGTTLSYEFTPIFKGSLYAFRNLEDSSRFLSPVLNYSLDDNSSVQIGAQWFRGGRTSEYGQGRNLYYLQWQRYF